MTSIYTLQRETVTHGRVNWSDSNFVVFGLLLHVLYSLNAILTSVLIRSAEDAISSFILNADNDMLFKHKIAWRKVDCMV